MVGVSLRFISVCLQISYILPVAIIQPQNYLSPASFVSATPLQCFPEDPRHGDHVFCCVVEHHQGCGQRQRVLSPTWHFKEVLGPRWSEELVRFERATIRVENRGERRWHCQTFAVCILFATGGKWTSTNCPSSHSSHYKISEIPKSENVLQSGYPFADPADAFAVVSEKIDKFEPSLASWIIERVPNPLKAWSLPWSIISVMGSSYLYSCSRPQSCFEFFWFKKPKKKKFSAVFAK